MSSLCNEETEAHVVTEPTFIKMMPKCQFAVLLKTSADNLSLKNAISCLQRISNSKHSIDEELSVAKAVTGSSLSSQGRLVYLRKVKGQRKVCVCLCVYVSMCVSVCINLRITNIILLLCYMGWLQIPGLQLSSVSASELTGIKQ